MNTMMRGFLLAGGVATLVAFAQPNAASAEGPKGSGITTITVLNQRLQDVTVYIERGDTDLRLGKIPGGQEETLQVPSWMSRFAGEARVYIRPKDGIDLASDNFTLKPGAHLFVRIPGR